MIGNQAGSHVILSGEGVAGNEEGVGTSGFESDRQVRGFSCDVAAGD
jgi:hypothetical protein